MAGSQLEQPSHSTGAGSFPPVTGPTPTGDEKKSPGSAHLRALGRVSAALCGLSDLHAILRVGLDSVFDLLEGAVGGILLIDDDTQTLSYRIAEGLPGQAVEETTLAVGEGIAGRVVATGRAILIEDISLGCDAAKDGLATGEIPSQELRAFASVPLRSHHRAFGAINAASRTPRRFDSDDVYVLNSIGEQMGVAIEQAEFLEQARTGRKTYQRLARLCLVAQDDERRRIARELHDETSQSISALALNMRALVELASMSGQNQELVDRLKKVESMAQQTAHELTRIINDLRPALLDSAGLVPAIRRFAQEKLESQGIEVSVQVNGIFPRLSTEVEANLFRFVQGALTNVARHAEARTVNIVMNLEEQNLKLSIRDDGKGFAVSEITGIDEETDRGRGLFAMKERIRLLGGSCEVQSAPGRGTAVMANIPVGSLENVQDTSPGSR